MRKYDELKKKKNSAVSGIKQGTYNLEKISEESERVANVARDVSIIINDIEKNFKQVTKLNKIDISFLMLAISLQCARQYIFANDKFRLDKASDGDKLIKDPLKKVTPKEWHDTLFGSVPYDATRQTENFKKLDLKSGISGSTHRYRALGHDPILGWIIGPINILSDSLTKNDFTTYTVKNMKLDGVFEGDIAGAIKVAHEQGTNDPWNIPAAIIKQAIHFGADYFTKQGLPIPVLSIANEDMARKMLSKNYRIDTYSVMRGATMSIFINSIIECIHTLFYDEVRDISTDLYKVRTRKILMYSNIIASSSNIIYTAISEDLTKLDVGGILVTLYRIVSDTKFINEVKKEFLEKEFYNKVMGNDIGLIWEENNEY
ncbi:hypothetical protein [Clostridium nigeriense]|uniref:hypothetical protein n=1 Tax=Clostridium nigeriense TaxID=1805470 RepID=UPI0008297214|nr:hypothetical protein [Clostridium nigeriense]